MLTREELVELKEEASEEEELELEREVLEEEAEEEVHREKEVEELVKAERVLTSGCSCCCWTKARTT